MSRVSVPLPVNRARSFQKITTKWGRRSVILQSATFRPHARFAGAEPALTVSHSETLSCARLCGLLQTTFPSLKARFHTCHSCFPWHTAHRGPSWCPSVCSLPPCSTLLQCSLHFPKTNLDPRPSKAVTPLVRTREDHVRVLSAVNNEQNRYILAVDKQREPRCSPRPFYSHGGSPVSPGSSRWPSGGLGP